MTTYQPSSSEKKAAVLIYLLIGSIMILHKDHISERVWGHLQQALGRWIIFMLFAFVSLILVFVPLLSLIPLAGLAVIVGIWGYFAHKARSGETAIVDGGLSFFTQLGKRMTDVMDIHPEIITEDSTST